MTINGKKSFNLKDGSSSTFLKDGDGVRTTGLRCLRVMELDFGDCVGKVPAPVLKAKLINGHK